MGQNDVLSATKKTVCPKDRLKVELLPVSKTLMVFSIEPIPFDASQVYDPASDTWTFEISSRPSVTRTFSDFDMGTFPGEKS